MRRDSEPLSGQARAGEPGFRAATRGNPGGSFAKVLVLVALRSLRSCINRNPDEQAGAWRREARNAGTAKLI